MRPSSHDSRAARLADRITALAGLGLLIWLTQALLARATPADAALPVAVRVVCALGALALLPALIPARGAGSLGALLATARKHPWPTALLLFDGLLLGIALLVVLGEWGVLLGVVVSAAGWARVSLSPATARPEVSAGLVRGAALGATILLLGLAAGELWLRAHPERVGGGGGGNPALAVLHAGLYEYNAAGLRGPAPSAAPDLRIVAVGDSFTFGQGVGEADTWPAQLRRLLDAQAPGRRHDVVNGGRPGLDTRGELDWLRERAAELQPDLVVAQFYVNDVIQHRPVGADVARPWPTRVLAAARRNAWVLFHLQDRVQDWQLREQAGRRGRPDWLSVFARHVERADAAWQSCASALDDLGAWARATDTPLLLVLYPHPGPAHPGTATVHAAVAERAGRAGLEVLDLAPLVTGLPPARQIAAPYDHHPSPELHALAANAIHAALSDLGWLP